LNDGGIIEEQEIFIRGMTRRPLTLEDINFKYQDCGSVAGLPPDEVEAIVSIVGGLEQLDDLTPLLEHLGRNRTQI
jgi:hypothetical protein